MGTCDSHVTLGGDHVMECSPLPLYSGPHWALERGSPAPEGVCVGGRGGGGGSGMGASVCE